MYNAVWGNPKYNIISGSDLSIIAEMSARVPMMNYTLLGYISEHRVASHLLQYDDITNITKIPDLSATSRGDLRFMYNGSNYTVEVKTLGIARQLRNGRTRATISMGPTRRAKNETIRAYHVGAFDLLAVNLQHLGPPLIWYARTSALPRHKHDPSYLASSMTIYTDAGCVPPFTTNPLELLQSDRFVSV